MSRIDTTSTAQFLMAGIKTGVELMSDIEHTRIERERNELARQKLLEEKKQREATQAAIAAFYKAVQQGLPTIQEDGGVGAGQPTGEKSKTQQAENLLGVEVGTGGISDALVKPPKRNDGSAFFGFPTLNGHAAEKPAAVRRTEEDAGLLIEQQPEQKREEQAVPPTVAWAKRIMSSGHPLFREIGETHFVNLPPSMQSALISMAKGDISEAREILSTHQTYLSAKYSSQGNLIPFMSAEMRKKFEEYGFMRLEDYPANEKAIKEKEREASRRDMLIQIEEVDPDLAKKLANASYETVLEYWEKAVGNKNIEAAAIQKHIDALSKVVVGEERLFTPEALAIMGGLSKEKLAEISDDVARLLPVAAGLVSAKNPVDGSPLFNPAVVRSMLVADIGNGSTTLTDASKRYQESIMLYEELLGKHKGELKDEQKRAYWDMASRKLFGEVKSVKGEVGDGAGKIAVDDSGNYINLAGNTVVFNSSLWNEIRKQAEKAQFQEEVEVGKDFKKLYKQARDIYMTANHIIKLGGKVDDSVLLQGRWIILNGGKPDAAGRVSVVDAQKFSMAVNDLGFAVALGYVDKSNLDQIRGAIKGNLPPPPIEFKSRLDTDGFNISLDPSNSVFKRAIGNGDANKVKDRAFATIAIISQGLKLKDEYIAPGGEVLLYGREPGPPGSGPAEGRIALLDMNEAAKLVENGDENDIPEKAVRYLTLDEWNKMKEEADKKKASEQKRVDAGKQDEKKSVRIVPTDLGAIIRSGNKYIPKDLQKTVLQRIADLNLPDYTSDYALEQLATALEEAGVPNANDAAAYIAFEAARQMGYELRFNTP